MVISRHILTLLVIKKYIYISLGIWVSGRPVTVHTVATVIAQAKNAESLGCGRRRGVQYFVEESYRARSDRAPLVPQPTNKIW